MSNYKTTKDYWALVGTMAMMIGGVLIIVAVGFEAYERGYEKGRASVKGTYLTPSVQDVDIQCMAWLFDVGAAQAKARICKK